MLDQFFEHGQGGRPPVAYRNGVWVQGSDGEEEFTPRQAISQNASMLTRPALRHDMVTGEARYRDWIVAWANAVDEVENATEQMMADVFVGAHYYTGDPAWLARAYAMDLRTWAALEQDTSSHMCYAPGRYGSKFLMESSYQPMLGGIDWSTRGGMPVLGVRHVTDGHDGLPQSVAFRIWRQADGVDAFEAVNRRDEPATWHISAAQGARALDGVDVDDQSVASDADGFPVSVGPKSVVSGRLHWRR